MESVIQGSNGGGLDQMVDNLSGLFEDDAKYGNAVENLKATIANIRHISEALDSSIGDHPEDVGSIISNFRDMSDYAKTFTKDLADITQTRKEDLKVALGKFREISEKLDAILTKIDKGEGTIGALVSDKKTADDVKAAVASIKETASSAQYILGRVNKINTYWNYRYRYSTQDSESRSDVGITFVPRPGKFYSVGATNVGQMPDDEKHTKYERVNRITAVMGGDWGPWTGYAGAIRSRGGVGLNFRPLFKLKKWDRRVELQWEGADFARDVVINGERFDKPWMAVGVRFALTRWLSIGVREEDILERPDFQTSANINLLDRDFAYLLGLTSLAR